MAPSKNVIRLLVSAFRGDSPSPKRTRTRQVTPMVDGLEDRVVLSQLGGFPQFAHQMASLQAALPTMTTATNTTGTPTGPMSSTSNTALATARQTLRNDIQTIELASGTTIGQLTAIRSAFTTLANDGLRPSSPSALASFENSLVKSFASGTTLTNNATLLAQFEALFTTAPTAQQTTDLTAAYNALAAAVTSSNITSADLATIDADRAAVLAAMGSTSTSTGSTSTSTGSTSTPTGSTSTPTGSTSTPTFPYFSLVTGRAGGVGAFRH